LATCEIIWKVGLSNAENRSVSVAKAVSFGRITAPWGDNDALRQLMSVPLLSIKTACELDKRASKATEGRSIIVTGPGLVKSSSALHSKRGIMFAAALKRGKT
jgi:hypothetical protein